MIRGLLRHFYTATESGDKDDLQWTLSHCLAACWDVGPLSAEGDEVRG